MIVTISNNKTKILNLQFSQRGTGNINFPLFPYQFYGPPRFSCNRQLFHPDEATWIWNSLFTSIHCLAYKYLHTVQTLRSYYATLPRYIDHMFGVTNTFDATSINEQDKGYINSCRAVVCTASSSEVVNSKPTVLEAMKPYVDSPLKLISYFGTGQCNRTSLTNYSNSSAYS
jgi:hypothetical protein